MKTYRNDKFDRLLAISDALIEMVREHDDGVMTGDNFLRTNNLLISLSSMIEDSKNIDDALCICFSAAFGVRVRYKSVSELRKGFCNLAYDQETLNKIKVFGNYDVFSKLAVIDKYFSELERLCIQLRERIADIYSAVCDVTTFQRKMLRIEDMPDEMIVHDGRSEPVNHWNILHIGTTLSDCSVYRYIFEGLKLLENKELNLINYFGSPRNAQHVYPILIKHFPEEFV